MRSIFEFENYRDYLNAFIDGQTKGGKLRLASVLECQPGYLSQILSENADISIEQAHRFASHLGLESTATQFLMLLVLHSRAGNRSLKEHFKKEIDQLRSEAQVLKNRFKPEKILTVEDQATFYSSWHYGALHVSVSIPECDTEQGMSEYFKLPMKRVNEVVQFLERVGLILRGENGRLSIGSSQIFVGADSPLISKHHTNWRLKCIQAQDMYKENHLHYSSVVSISLGDVDKVREIMVQAIQQIRTIVRASKDEKCFSYGMDLFEVRGE